MASLKELKGRINSVKSTQKITKAKQMVAAAKLRKAQAAAEAARPYAARLAAVMTSLAAKVAGQDNAPKLLTRQRRRPASPAGGRQQRQGPGRRVQFQHRARGSCQSARAEGGGQDGRVLPDRPQGPPGDPPRLPRRDQGPVRHHPRARAGLRRSRERSPPNWSRCSRPASSTSRTYSTRASSRRWPRSRPSSRSSRSPRRRKPPPTPARWSSTSRARRKSSPSCCRATCARSCSVRCSRTWPANRARR